MTRALKGKNEQSTYKRRHTAFGDVLLRAIRLKHDFPLHRRDYYGFAVIDAGVEAFFARGGNHLVTSGDTVLLNPEDAHSGAPYGEGWSYRMLTLEPDTIADLTRDRRNFGGSPLFREAVNEEARSSLHL